MADRPVTLDLNAPRLGGDAPAGQGGGTDAAPRDEDVSRFRQAMDQGQPREQDPGGAAAGGEGAEGSARPSPFSLFGAAASPAGGAFGLFGGFSGEGGGPPAGEPAEGQAASGEGADPSAGTPAPAAANPFQPLSGLFSPGASAVAAAPAPHAAAPLPPPAAQVVGEVAERILVSTEAAQEVRVLIRNDVLPGVEVRILQEQGRWVMDFSVTDAASLGLLQSAGDRIAAELSRRLRKAVELRVADPRRAQEQPGAEQGAVFVEDLSREAASPLSGLPSINTRFPDEPR